MHPRIGVLARVPALALLAALTLTAPPSADAAMSSASATTATVPQFDHVVVVMFENKNYSTIKGGSSAPYLNSLASQGTLFTSSFGITHPSQPNYIALFSGSQQGVTNDDCPKSLSGGNLGQQLLNAGRTFKAYSEGLPSAGYIGCSSGKYRRKHAPWADFPTVSGSAYHVAYSAFPTDYSKLPTVSFVIPDMCNDMHDCSVGTGDSWTKDKLDGYAQWAKTHNSLLIATFDEDNFTSVNQIYTVFAGAHVKAGYQSGTQINHYNVLRTIEDMYGLPALGNAAGKSPITDAWTTSTPGTTVFSDDFESDKGWQVDASGTDTATAGQFERGVPQQTTSTYSDQVKQLTAASGSHALTTGAAAGAAYGDNDLDGGTTTVASPQITLPTTGPLTLRLSYNLAHGDNSGADDHLRIGIAGGPTLVDRTGAASEAAGAWQGATADLSAYAGTTVRLSLEAADAGTASLFEAEIDDLSITQG
ncbi:MULTISPECIES: alkaline phosphatase family protein [unclassified Nonomuraea]|uniref:alkaline phosphatase family protein n=1 Tax=unclassified Nonomuraea TaxID=2593643 RepID=UPI00340CFD50